MNEEIKRKLQSLANDPSYSNSWETFVPMIAFAIRVSKHRAIGFSPFEVMYGRQALFPGQFEPLKEHSFMEVCPERICHIVDELIKVTLAIRE